MYTYKRENLPQPMQMQLSKKQKYFSLFFAAFVKSTSNFEHFPEKMGVIVDVFPTLENAKNMTS